AAVALIAFTAGTPPHEEDQGTRLHGTGDYEYVNIPLNGCSLSGGTLSCGSTRLKGHGFTAPYQGRTITYVIDDVHPHCNIRSKSRGGCVQAGVEYAVSIGKAPLCGKGNWALAVPNAWTTGGEIVETKGYFTFACVPNPSGGGVIAKCVDWGYPPWPDAAT